MIILNGFDGLQSVEVVDLNSTTTTCKSLPDFPLNLRGSYGDLIDGKTPLVCGGYNSKSCYVYSDEGWKSTFNLSQVQFHFAGMSSSPFRNSSHKFFIIGRTAMEVLTPTGWEKLDISLPVSSVYAQCMIVVNETTVLLMAGTSPTSTYSRETYIFNSITNSWTRGPLLTNGRRAMGCGTIKENAASNNRIFLVAGGEAADKSVELLDSLTGQWRAGYLQVLRHKRVMGC